MQAPRCALAFTMLAGACRRMPHFNCVICLQPMLFPAAHLGLFGGCSPGPSASQGPVDLSNGNFKARMSWFASCILAGKA